MSAKDTIGQTLRFLASGGMADEDPEVVSDLLTRAHDLATAILADSASSPALRTKAQVFLEILRSDAYRHYGADAPEPQRALPL